MGVSAIICVCRCVCVGDLYGCHCDTDVLPMPSLICVNCYQPLQLRYTGFIAGGKPGKCPKIVTPSPLPPCPQLVDRCFNDDDCQGTHKCCRHNFCGGHMCMPPVTGRVVGS